MRPNGFRADRPRLTDRENTLLTLICDGLTNSDIAKALAISKETVKSELKRIFRKIGVVNRTQAAVLFVRLAQPVQATDAAG